MTIGVVRLRNRISSERTALQGRSFSTGEENYELSYKGIILPHYYYADFVVWDKILFEAKAVEKLSDSHVKQVLNFWSILAAIPSNGKGLFYERQFHQPTRIGSNLMKFVPIRAIRVC